MTGTTVNPFGGDYTPDPLAQFLSRVVPWVPGGYVNIHYDFPGKRGVPGRAYAALDEYGTLKGLIDWLNAKGSNLYFCIAQVADFEGLNPKNGERKARRKGAIARWARSFVLDLDVKRGAYPSQKAALTAVLPWLDKMGLKAGFITSSGNGIHVYIVLDQPVGPEVWRPVASQLAAAAEAAKLHADFKVTRNAVSLVRLPYGKNWKDPQAPKDCRVLSVGPDMTLAALQAAVAAYPITSGVSTPVEAKPGLVLDPAVFPRRPPIIHGPDFNRVSAEREKNRVVTSVDLLCAACPVVRDSEGRGGDTDIEPLWFELAKLCHYVQDGRDYFHRLSDQDPRYDRAATDQKFDTAQGLGWPQCATIAAASPAASAICKSCAFNGQGQSPINYAVRGLLGTTGAAMPMQAALPAPVAQPLNGHVNGASAFAPVLQAGNPIFLNNLSAIGHNLVNGFIVNGAGQQVFKTPVSNIDCVWETDRSGRSVLRVNVTIPDGTQTNDNKIVTFLAGEIASPGGATSVRNQGLTFEPKQHAAVVTTVDDYTTYVRRQLAAGKETRLGWVTSNGTITGFCYGGFTFDTNGKHFSFVPSPEHALTPRGNLADWRTAANFWVGRGCVEMEVMMATAFASPLLAITSSSGVIVFARSNTGHGKTASLKTSASVWGSMQQVPTSVTVTWIDTEIALKNNLPVYWDELVPSPKQGSARFGEAVLRITSGTERGRNDRNNNHGTIRISRTMLIAASNHSLTEIASTKDTGAQAARVMEIEMSDALKRLAVPESVTAQVQMALENNCGQAGLVYAEYLGKNHANVAAAVTATMQWFESKLGIDSAERYWMNASAVLLVGATISKKLGLIDFDILSMRKFLLEQLRRQRAAVKDMAVDPDDPDVQLARIKNFMNTNRNWVVTDTLVKPGGATPCALIPSNDLHYQQMRGGFALRYAVNDKRVLISEDKLKLWTSQQEINYRQLRKTLIKHKYCTQPHKPRSLTSGTRLHSAPEAVLIFDLTMQPNTALIVEDDGV